jgi:hypothetical protein
VIVEVSIIEHLQCDKQGEEDAMRKRDDRSFVSEVS